MGLFAVYKFLIQDMQELLLTLADGYTCTLCWFLCYCILSILVFCSLSDTFLIGTMSHFASVENCMFLLNQWQLYVCAIENQVERDMNLAWHIVVMTETISRSYFTKYSFLKLRTIYLMFIFIFFSIYFIL